MSVQKKVMFPLEITDSFLIGWFKENYLGISFINYVAPIDTYKRNTKLITAVTNLKDNLPLHKQKNELLKIWKNLLGSAIVFLKSKDIREKYHDDEDYGVDKLSEFFETYEDFEGILYGAKEFYRDHVSHMFQVFLLGEYLIKKILKFDNIEVGDSKFPKTKKISSKEKEAMWCILSMTHDLGYALETIPEINEKARKMFDQFGKRNLQELVYTFPINPLCDFLVRFISSKLRKNEADNQYLTHIQSKYYLKFSNAFEKYNHGIISCIVLMKNLVYFLESDFTLDKYKPMEISDARQFLIRSVILRSIASHDCDDIYYLTIPQFPFLLRLFDEMQEWDRPKLEHLFKKCPETKLNIKELSEKNVHYEVKVRYKDVSDDEEKNMKIESHNYFIARCKTIRRILRSAVGKNHRELELTFELCDEIGSQEKYKTYKIVHKNPEDVAIYINNGACSWQELLSHYEE